MADGVAISAVVEGIVDEAVARTLILFAGASPGPVYGKQGKPFLQQRIRGYNTAAQHAPWIVLVDLDTDHNCAPLLCVSWLSQLAPRLCFRVAVRAVEAWLLADAERIAAFLRISRSKVPADPESLDNPKAAMVALARASRRMDIREDMVPRDGSDRPVGPAYASRIIEFAVFVATTDRGPRSRQPAASNRLSEAPRGDRMIPHELSGREPAPQCPLKDGPAEIQQPASKLKLARAAQDRTAGRPIRIIR